MRSSLMAVLVVFALMLAGCNTGGVASPSPSPVSSPPPQLFGDPGAPGARAATALVRAGAVEPKPVASAPITLEGQEAKGGTFHVFSVRSTETSTRLEFVVTHPTESSLSDVLFRPNRRPFLPKLTAGGVEYSVSRFSGTLGGWFDVMGDEYRVRPRPHPLFASFAPLPAGVSEVEVSTPLISAPLKVKVERGVEAAPLGSDTVPVLGRVVYGNNGISGGDSPLIVTLHGVRRLGNATAIYYSTAFPEGASPVSIYMWGGGSNVMNRIPTLGDDIASSVGMLDYSTMTGYSQFGTINTKQGCFGGLLSEATARGAAVCWALLPPLAAGTSRVDVILGGQMLLQDVPVSSGVMVPESTEKIPMLGAGWPRIPAESLALASAESFERATSRLRYVVKEGAITTSGEQLDLDSTVLFDYNQASLTAAAQGVLVKAAQQVKASGRAGVVSVIGHTDSDGSDGANLELSKRRAQAVADALSPLLGAGYTFAVDGKGEADPVAPNDTDAGKAANRRVTILPPK